MEHVNLSFFEIYQQKHDFHRNRAFFENLKKTIFLTSEFEKNVQNCFFIRNFDFPEKYATSAPEWYIYIGRTPSSSRDLMLQIQGVHFYIYSMNNLISGTLIYYLYLF